MTHEQWETVAGAVDAAEVDERALHAARDAVASLRAEHAEMAALLASIAHGGAVSGGLSLNDAWSRERMRDEARALLAPYPGGSVVSGAPGEGPTNATHIFCRTCHGWWPRPDGCPHHGAADSRVKVTALEREQDANLVLWQNCMDAKEAAEAKVTALEAALRELEAYIPGRGDTVRTIARRGLAALDRQEL